MSAMWMKRPQPGREQPAHAEQRPENMLLDAEDQQDWLADLPSDNAAAAQRTLRHVEIVFRAVSFVLPGRLADEELGDVDAEGLVGQVPHGADLVLDLVERAR